jgi:hypothetical protein
VLQRREVLDLYRSPGHTHKHTASPAASAMAGAVERGESDHSGSKLQSPLLPLSSAESADELESILSDESVPWGKRISAATSVEMRLLMRLAAPAVLVYMINYLMSMSTGIQMFAYGLMVRLPISKVVRTRTHV